MWTFELALFPFKLSYESHHMYKTQKKSWKKKKLLWQTWPLSMIQIREEQYSQKVGMLNCTWRNLWPKCSCKEQVSKDISHIGHSHIVYVDLILIKVNKQLCLDLSVSLYSPTGSCHHEFKQTGNTTFFFSTDIWQKRTWNQVENSLSNLTPVTLRDYL